MMNGTRALVTSTRGVQAGVRVCSSWQSCSYLRKRSEDQALHPRVRALFSVTTGAQNKPWSERGPQLCQG